MYPCEGCHQSWTSASGLAHHQHFCAPLHAEWSELHEHRRHKLGGRKRARREEYERRQREGPPWKFHRPNEPTEGPSERRSRGEAGSPAADWNSEIVDTQYHGGSENNPPPATLASENLHDEALQVPECLPETENDIVLSSATQVAETSETHSHSGRVQRPNRRLPLRYRDILPRAPPTLPAPVPDGVAEPSGPSRITLRVRDQLRTPANVFGVYRHFYDRPSYDPDGELTLEDLAGFVGQGEDEGRQASSPLTPMAPYHPFPNPTTFLLGNYWLNTQSGERSDVEFDRLIKTILDERFHAEDLRNFNSKKMKHILDKLDTPQEDEPSVLGGWRRNVSVSINIPEGRHHWTNPNGRSFTVPGLHYRSITEVIRTVFQSDRSIHFTPFKQMWQSSPSATPERIYSDIYSAPAFEAAHHEVNFDPTFSVPGCKLEKTVAAIMVWSDSTHLAQFGTASLWPIYLFFGNHAKLFRGKPNAHKCEHLAYIPALPDEIQDFIQDFVDSGSAKGPLLTHCKRELIQAVWVLLLDEDFIQAYMCGIVITCADGITRRVYPRFITYSADYPEKMIMLSLRDKGTCPCPRCLIVKNEIAQLGTHHDRHLWVTKIRVDSQFQRDDIARARSFIYGERAYAINSTAVENLLKPASLVPTINAFSKMLSPLKFQLYPIFTVDLLHEVELGVWKSLFSHLIRLLNEVGLEKVHTLNHRLVRYRMIPTFGRDTIRRFANNVSDMKKLAGRDFEDMLQCAMPAFQGLFPEPHDSIIQDLLFTLASWHALAKLRMHTDSTLSRLDALTTLLGKRIRRFAQVTCATFETHELAREVSARARRQAKTVCRQPGNSSMPKAPTLTPKVKPFNLSTPKLHALGDYVAMIRHFGTTDSYSTQSGELEHRRSKRRYMRVSKAKPAEGMTRMDRRETHMRQIREHVATTSGNIPDRFHDISSIEHEKLPYTDPGQRFHISPSQRHFVEIGTFLQKNSGDPATKDFYPRLKDHILGRLLGLDYNGDETEFTDADRDTVLFYNNRMYRHQTLRVNFTTYDMRRSQDSFNPTTNHCDVLVQARDDPNSIGYHPFWYARILGIFHVNVMRNIPGQPSDGEWTAVQFLWVRWFGRADSPRQRQAVNPHRLDRIGFVTEDDDTEPFGFLDPANVIRACHLIPAFAYGRTDDLLPGRSIARHVDDGADWMYYYVSRFVDRDMMMLFIGGGVGHTIHYEVGNALDDAVPDHGGGSQDPLTPPDAEHAHKHDAFTVTGGVGNNNESDSSDELDESAGSSEDESEESQESITYGSP